MEPLLKMEEIQSPSKMDGSRSPFGLKEATLRAKRARGKGQSWGGLSVHEWCGVATVFPKVKMTGSVDGEERELGPGPTAPHH